MSYEPLTIEQEFNSPIEIVWRAILEKDKALRYW